MVFMPVQSQTVNEIFSRLQQQYASAKPLQYKSSYALYKDANTENPYESYKGIFLKNISNEIYLKIDNTEIINSKQANIKIVHSEKAIIIAATLPGYVGEFDPSSITNYCTLSSFKDYKTYWEIVLATKKLSSLPYSKIVVHVSKDYLLKKQVFYYNTGIDFAKNYKKSEIHYPRLEIIYDSYNRNPVNANLFKMTTYFSSFGKEIKAIDKLKNYEIADKRAVSHKIINK